MAADQGREDATLWNVPVEWLPRVAIL